jgi:hypothetical protein
VATSLNLEETAAIESCADCGHPLSDHTTTFHGDSAIRQCETADCGCVEIRS